MPTETPALRPRSVRLVVLVTVLTLLASLTPAFADQDGTAPPPETVTDQIENFEVAEVADGWELSEIIESPIAFTMIGFGAPEGVELQARVAGDGWSDWFELFFIEPDDGPDVGGEEDLASTAAQDGLSYTEPVWVGEADQVQIRVVGGSVDAVKASVIDGDGVSRSLVQRARDALRPRMQLQSAEASTPLDVISRRQWGADESKRNGSPRYADEVRYGVVHHTAHSPNNPNGYSRTDAPAIMRSMYTYHTGTLGWSDLGYNIVIDRFGRIYEGRAGGLGRGVIGAHAGGFNTGSFGVAIMGNFQTVQPSAAARSALIDVFGWKMNIHDIAPNTTINVRSGGSGKYPSGTTVQLNTISAHRESSSTACPGAAFYSTFDQLRADIAARTPAQPPRHGFSDVSASRYYDRPVSWLSATSITDGYGNTGRYEPDLSVTRGEMASFIWRLAGSPTGYPHHGFSDVSSGRHFDPAVRWMKALGITDGYGDTGRFEPGLPVTRGETATFLWRYVGKPAGDPAHGFPDVSSGSFYNQAIRWMRANGITDGFGSSGEYRPNRSVTRGEMSAMLYRLASTPPAWRSANAISPHATFRLS